MAANTASLNSNSIEPQFIIKVETKKKYHMNHKGSYLLQPEAYTDGCVNVVWRLEDPKL